MWSDGFLDRTKCHVTLVECNILINKLLYFLFFPVEQVVKNASVFC